MDALQNTISLTARHAPTTRRVTLVAEKTFKKMRGINDGDLNRVLLHHAEVLRAMTRPLSLLLRERRLLLVWVVLVTATLIWEVLR